MKINFLVDISKVDTLVEIFTNNVGIEYITHIEIEEGRAVSLDKWAHDIKDVLREELIESCKELRVIAISIEDEISGFALLKFDEDSIIVEDIVVYQKGLGKELMNWIEDYAKRMGFNKLIGHVGCTNEVAKSFMNRLGFQEQTITYIKEI